MAETVRPVRRQPEESIVIEDFSGGMELNVGTNSINRIICNMFPRLDTKELECIRGNYTYKHAMTAWAGSSEISWLQDLHNEYVAVFRKGETKFYILDNADTPNLTSHDNVKNYGDRAFDVPKYSAKRLATTIGGWTVHGEPWTSWYDNIRAHSKTAGKYGGIFGAFEQVESTTDGEKKGNPYLPSQVLSITEAGFFTESTSGTTANQGIKTQQLGLPVPISTGLHISTSAGTALAGSRMMTSARLSSPKTGTVDNMGDRANLWCLCTDNETSSKHAPLVHKFHIDTTNHLLVHNIYTQTGGQRIYTYEYDITSAYLTNDKVSNPIACDVDEDGNVYVILIKDISTLTVFRFVPGNAGSAYTKTEADVTADLEHPKNVQMAYDKYTQRIFAFILDDVEDTMTSYDSRRGASYNTGIMRVYTIEKGGAAGLTARGIIGTGHAGYSITHFTADFVADGYENDNDLANATKRCIFGMFLDENDEDGLALYWGYFDSATTSNGETILSMCNGTRDDYTITNVSTDPMTNPKTGGVNEATVHVHLGGDRRWALQMAAKSRQGPTCEVVFSYGCNHSGWDNAYDGLKYFKSRSCPIEKPELDRDGTFSYQDITGGKYAVDSKGNTITTTANLHHWRNINLPIYGNTNRNSYHERTDSGSAGNGETALRVFFPGHRGDCLNRMSIHGDTYIRYEIMDTEPGNLVKIHYHLDGNYFDAYESEYETYLNHRDRGDSEVRQLGQEGLGPYETGGLPGKPTGYPNDNIEETLGVSLAPHWEEQQNHIPTHRPKFIADVVEEITDGPSMFYPMADTSAPFLAYPSYREIEGTTTTTWGIYCHPPIHGGAVYKQETGLNPARPGSTSGHRVDFDEPRWNASNTHYLKNPRLYAGSNFHPLTPFEKRSGEVMRVTEYGLPKYKTWNNKNPLMAGQDINILTRVKTIKGEVKPGKYRYKFSFAKAGAEEPAYRSTGGEGAIFWDNENEAFFEWDSTRSNTDKGIRLYFNMGLLRKPAGSWDASLAYDSKTHLLKLKAELTDNTSTHIEVLPVWDGTPRNVMGLYRVNGPSCRYDYWSAYDIMTSPFSRDTYSHFVDEDGNSKIVGRKIDEDQQSTGMSYHNPRGQMIEAWDELGAGDQKFQHDSGGNISADKHLYRHGKNTFGETYETVTGEQPYIKKILIWRTGDVSKPTTDKSKYYKVGEFEIMDEEDTRGWSGYFFDDVFDTLELSGELGDRAKLPPLTDDITAMAVSSGRLFIANNPKQKRTTVDSSHVPSQIQFSGSHWENFPRGNVIVLDDTAVVHYMKDYQGSLFVFTDVGTYVVSGTDNPASMTSSKLSEMVIHKHENDSEVVIEVEGTLFTLGVDGLYQLVQGGFYKLSSPMDEWFQRKGNQNAMGMYFDKNTQSVIIYNKENNGVTDVKFKTHDSTAYIDEICYHIPTKSWWCKGGEVRYEWSDIINVASNDTSTSSQYTNTRPNSLVYGIRGYSTTVDNIIQIGRGKGNAKTDNSGTGVSGVMEYYYETAVLGTSKVERYWDKVDIEVIPVASTDGLSYDTATMNFQLDKYSIDSSGARNEITYGTNTTASFKDLYIQTESYTALPKLIERVETSAKAEYVRARLNFSWTRATGSGLLNAPRIKALRFRTRVIGISRNV